MLKHTAEEVTVEGYVSALSRRLRNALPAETAESVVAETAAHLRDQVEELTDSGMEKAAAEAQAVGGFGRVSAYSSAVVRSAFDDRVSAGARKVAAGLGLCVLGIALGLAEERLRLPEFLHPGYGWYWRITRPEVLYFTVFLAFMTFSFCGKRPQTRLFATAALLAVIAAFVSGGFFYVGQTPLHRDMSRVELAGIARPDTAYQADLENDILLLKSGCQFFETDQTNVPAELLQNGRIIVPRLPTPLRTLRYYESDDALRSDYDHERLNAIWEGRFNAVWLPRDTAIYDAYTTAQRAAHRAAPYLVADNIEDARRLWRHIGKRWLDAREKSLKEYVAVHRRWDAIRASEPDGFNLAAAKEHGARFAVFCVYVIIADAGAALLGRCGHRFRKNRRRVRA